MVKCYFTDETGKSPFPPSLIQPPLVGSLMFYSDGKETWKVMELQYQWRWGPMELELINVILQRIYSKRS